MIRVAILDMYLGKPNEGMRCIKMLVNNFFKIEGLEGHFDVYDVRQKNEVPAIDDYDIFISTGGPGNPLPEGHDWESKYFHFLEEILKNNKKFHKNGRGQLKHLFLICHSFQMASYHLGFGLVCKRFSTSFGVMPIHRMNEAIDEPLFDGLPEPFYAVDSRDYQLIQPNWKKINDFGAKVLCLEKVRPHIPLERAIMAIRFSDEVFGTQFHPEADAEGMLHYFQQEERMMAVIKEYGIEKYESMIDHLDDEDKIMLTESIIIPKFLKNAAEQILSKRKELMSSN
jgi:homoserine O-succinyltransferase